MQYNNNNNWKLLYNNNNNWKLFHQNDVDTETLQMRYRTGYLYVYRFSKKNPNLPKLPIWGFHRGDNNFLEFIVDKMKLLQLVLDFYRELRTVAILSTWVVCLTLYNGIFQNKKHSFEQNGNLILLLAQYLVQVKSQN